MVMVHIAIKTGHRFNVTGFSRNPERRKSLQRAVHGCSRYARDAIFDVLIYLIDGRMILAVQQSVKNGPPLYRHRESPLTTSVFQTRDLRLFV